MNLSTNLDKAGVEELRKRAIDQVEEIGSILEVGKELRLSVDQTLSAFQAFTGGNLTETLRRAGESALSNLAPGTDRDTRREAVSAARTARADQLSDQFRDEQIRAELAGTDMSQILTLSTAGAATLQQRMGVSGLEPAIRGQALGLTEAAYGLGLSDKDIANQATAATETFLKSPQGRAGSVLLSSIERGVLDASDPKVAALVKQFQTTGDLTSHEVMGALSGAGLTKREMVNTFSDAGLVTAMQTSGVAEQVTRALTRDEDINFTGMLRGAANDITDGKFAGIANQMLRDPKYGAESERVNNLFLEAYRSGRGFEHITEVAESMGVNASGMSDAYRRFETQADIYATGDARMGSTEAGIARARLEAMDPEEREKVAATQRKFEDAISKIARGERTRKALTDLGLSEEDASAMAVDDEALDTQIADWEKAAQDADDAGDPATAKKFKNKIAALKTARKGTKGGEDALKRLGTILSNMGGSEGTDLQAATIQEIIETAFGSDREGVRESVLGLLGEFDKDGNLVGVKKDKALRERLGLGDVDEDTLTQLMKSLDVGVKRTASDEAEAQAAAAEAAALEESDPPTAEEVAAKEDDTGKKQEEAQAEQLEIWKELMEKIGEFMEVINTLIGGEAVINVNETNPEALNTAPIETDGGQ